MKNRLGDILVRDGIVTPEQLTSLLNIQKDSGKRLGELVVEMGYGSERQVTEALSQQTGVPIFNVRSMCIDREAAGLISEEMARRLNVMPIRIEEGKRLVLAMADPLDFNAIGGVEIKTGLSVSPVIDSPRNIRTAVNLYYSRENTEEALRDMCRISNEEAGNDNDDDFSDAPAIRLVDSVIRQAVLQKASDIHIEPLKGEVRVRIRLNGELIDFMRLSAGTHDKIVARIKIIGNMNIAEHRIPQDGRATLTVEGREIDLRLSTLPTVNGEKVVIRLLDHKRLEQLIKNQSLFGESKRLVDDMTARTSGIILVTGPTGSGKTTTLYSLLSDMNKDSRNIITIEDPVEYKIDGINQTQVNNKSGYTFAKGLRAVLRQDPDIIMVGEIRDSETASIAIRAAITGHLVLSTMHTGDTAGTVARLMDMGIEPYLLSSALIGVVAQRLIRGICSECKKPYTAEKAEKNMLGIDDEEPLTLFKGEGCWKCRGTGYSDRFAVYEVLPLYRGIRELINNNASADEIRDKAFHQYGVVSLSESLVKLIREGRTTVDEIKKVCLSTDL